MFNIIWRAGATQLSVHLCPDIIEGCRRSSLSSRESLVAATLLGLAHTSKQTSLSLFLSFGGRRCLLQASYLTNRCLGAYSFNNNSSGAGFIQVSHALLSMLKLMKCFIGFD